MAGCSGPIEKTKFFPGCLYKSLFTLALFALVGFVYQFVGSRRDAANFPPPGEFVDLGGYRLHFMQSGQDGPTVVLEAGLGDTSIVWSKIQDEVGQFARAVSYDRAGMGWSDLGPDPRDSQHIANELHSLLKKADIPGPYILVGHSMGGYHIRVFAASWPDEVVGMVLVDAAHEDQFDRFPPEISGMVRRQGTIFSVLSKLAPFGMVRLMGMVKGEGLDDEWKGAAVAVANRTQVATALAGELSQLDANIAQVKAAGNLGDIPLAVLTAEQKPNPGYTPEINETMRVLWLELQKDLAKLSSNSTQQVAEESEHHIHLTRPDLVIAAIRDVVDKARNTEVSGEVQSQ